MINVVEGLFDAGALWLGRGYVIIRLPTRCVYFKLLTLFICGNIRS